VHSSISSSEALAAAPAPAGTAHAYRTWSIRALLCLALFCVGLEGLTRFGFAHISHIEARIARDHKAALAIRKGSSPTVLLVGNSLMLEGIDEPRLRDALAGQANAVRFPIEQTQYLDWYYGLRRLFDEGSRPDMVVLCMNAVHLIATNIRGDYSAYYLFRLADIPEIAREIHYDLTKTSSLVLSRFSLFYAGRSALRNFALVSTDHPYALLLQRMGGAPPHLPPDAEMERVAEARLRDLQALCSSHGARFVYLVAPGFGPGEDWLVQAGARTHTDVMIPFYLNELSRDKFRDGFHLNGTGARLFTDRFARMLKPHISQ
jgi:hypothetical protein